MGHYLQQRRGEPLHEKTITRPEAVKKLCIIVGCENWGNRDGLLCLSHASVSRRFNLEPEILRLMLAGQCAICRTSGRLQVDHDHSCCAGNYSCGNCIRSALCPSCNNLVSLIENGRTVVKNVALVPEAHKYLACW